MSCTPEDLQQLQELQAFKSTITLTPSHIPVLLTFTSPPEAPPGLGSHGNQQSRGHSKERHCFKGYPLLKASTSFCNAGYCCRGRNLTPEPLVTVK